MSRLGRKGKRPGKDWRTDALLRAIEAGALSSRIDEFEAARDKAWLVRADLDSTDEELAAVGLDRTSGAYARLVERLRDELHRDVAAFALELVGRRLLGDSVARAFAFANQVWHAEKRGERPIYVGGRLRWSDQ